MIKEIVRVGTGAGAETRVIVRVVLGVKVWEKLGTKELLLLVGALSRTLAGLSFIRSTRGRF